MFEIILILLALPFLLILAGLLFVFIGTAGQRTSDEDVLKSYKPAAEIVEIAEKNTLTTKGKATFYRADPEIVEGDVFRKYCFANGVEALGCNAPKPGGGPFGGRKIFLLKIDDPKFSDHKYSAAIHEMLHSAYNRLSSDEKKRINALLETELDKYQDDPHLTGPLEILKKRKNSNIKTIQEELHSKFAVEYKELSPELEKYYKQYFTDRSKVVELFQKGGFNSRVRRLDQINSELGALNPKLTAMDNQLVLLKNSGDIDKFNSLVGQYNSLVGQYNANVAESKKVFSEVEKFYQYFNPDYKPPEEKKQ
ncbi:hypothetical protein HYW46_00060 [Candidatus Daviesbacteria bacterium]|nr:hypothetical protein [Candidatus Daviesbacteria bacterium]